MGQLWTLFVAAHERTPGTKLQGGYLQCDDTLIRCQDPDVPGKTVQGWLWVLSRPGADIVFEWRMSRAHAEAKTLLSGFKGVLHADAYSAYTAFAQANDDVRYVGCWAHARRRFRETLEEAPVRAGFVLRLIGHLYAMEAAWDEAKKTKPTERARLRERDFACTLSLLKKVAARVRPTARLGEACSYLLAQWEPLTAHLVHGQTRHDTNIVENAIRPTKLGAKNWLFIGHPDAGQRSAIIYAIVGSCRRHGIDPFLYPAMCSRAHAPARDDQPRRPQRRCLQSGRRPPRHRHHLIPNVTLWTSAGRILPSKVKKEARFFV